MSREFSFYDWRTDNYFSDIGWVWEIRLPGASAHAVFPGSVISTKDGKTPYKTRDTTSARKHVYNLNYNLTPISKRWEVLAPK